MGAANDLSKSSRLVLSAIAESLQAHQDKRRESWRVLKATRSRSHVCIMMASTACWLR